MIASISVINKCINYCEIELVLESVNWTDSRLHLETKDKAFSSLKRPVNSLQ